MAAVKKRYPSTVFGKRVEIYNQKALNLGEKVSIQNNVILHCGGADWCNNTGSISIGSQSVISPNCVFGDAVQILLLVKISIVHRVLKFSLPERSMKIQLLIHYLTHMYFKI